MCKKIEHTNVQKSHTVTRRKAGFTLVELSVVLALLAILSAMIVSFSVLMGGFAQGNNAQYAFLEDHAALKDALCTWVAENDGPEAQFTIADGVVLTVTENGTEKTAHFAGGVLFLDGQPVAGLEAIDALTFTTNGTLIKCVTYQFGEDGVRMQSSFVFSLRCGTIGEVAQDA